MACIGKIKASLAMPCGATGNMRPVAAKVLNASDVGSYTASATGGATITRVAGAVAYDLTAINNALTITVGIKSQDLVPGAYDVAITFKDFSLVDNLVSLGTGGSVNPISRSELIFAVDHGNGLYKVYGLGAPLVCTEMVYDSTGDGFVSYTYGVEDWQVGTHIFNLSKSDYDALSTPAAQPKLNQKENGRKIN